MAAKKKKAKKNPAYNLDFARTYCEHIGLCWLGDVAVVEAISDAVALNFTQKQFDAAMKHHLWQVRILFSPQSYRWFQRLSLAGWFLFGKMKPVK